MLDAYFQPSRTSWLGTGSRCSDAHRASGCERCAFGRAVQSKRTGALAPEYRFCLRRQHRQTALDRIIDSAARELRRYAYRIFHRVRVGRPMGDDANTLHAEPRRPAVLRMIEPFLEIGERAA